MLPLLLAPSTDFHVVKAEKFVVFTMDGLYAENAGAIFYHLNWG